MGRGTRSAPYFATMREGERRMLIGAIEACGSIEAAAAALGVTKEYVKIRAIHLGGVLPDQPKIEPSDAPVKTAPNVRAEVHTPKRKYTRKEPSTTRANQASDTPPSELESKLEDS